MLHIKQVTWKSAHGFWRYLKDGGHLGHVTAQLICTFVIPYANGFLVQWLIWKMKITEQIEV